LKKNGVPRDQIIHLAYDDVANDPANPFPGQIFNKPTDKGTPGVNVYDASDIDYRGDDVSKTNFFNALLGNDENGPALKSDENSNVFVYYNSYGGLGEMNTPGGSLDTIYAEQLANTLIKMHDKKMFKELVFYLEGSQSASMFDLVSTDLNIYALTSTDNYNLNVQAYCGRHGKVDGKNLGICLGDLFSVTWMEDLEANDPCTETLDAQAQTVMSQTVDQYATVQQHGD